MPPRKTTAPARPPGDARAALVMGGDAYKVKREARAQADRWCPPEQQEFGLEIIDGAVDTVDEAVVAVARTLEAMASLGLFGGEKTVWLRDASFFSDAQPGKSETVKTEVARLAELLKEGVPDGVRLLVSSPKVDRRSAFYKAFQAAGDVREFDVPASGYQADRLAGETLSGLLRGAGLRPAYGVEEAILRRAGGDTGQLVQEIEKLGLYLGSRREVSLADVETIISPARESAGWDLVDAVAQRDLAGSLRIARQLLFQKESPVMLVIFLENRIRELLALRELLDAGFLSIGGSGRQQQVDVSSAAGAQEAVSALVPGLTRQHPFRTLLIVKQASALPSDEWRRWLGVAIEAHARMTSGAATQELLLEFCILQLIRGGVRHAA